MMFRRRRIKARCIQALCLAILVHSCICEGTAQSAEKTEPQTSAQHSEKTADHGSGTNTAADGNSGEETKSGKVNVSAEQMCILGSRVYPEAFTCT